MSKGLNSGESSYLSCILMRSGTKQVGAPSKIIELVNRFREQQDSYRSPSYGEAALRQEFLDPLFTRRDSSNC